MLTGTFALSVLVVVLLFAPAPDRSVVIRDGTEFTMKSMMLSMFMIAVLELFTISKCSIHELLRAYK